MLCVKINKAHCRDQFSLYTNKNSNTYTFLLSFRVGLHNFSHISHFNLFVCILSPCKIKCCFRAKTMNALEEKNDQKWHGCGPEMNGVLRNPPDDFITNRVDVSYVSPLLSSPLS